MKKKPYLIASNDGLHPAGETKPTEAIIEYLIKFQRSCGIVRNLHASCKSVKYAIPPQDRMRLRRDQYAGLRVAEYVVLFQNALIIKNCTLFLLISVYILLTFPPLNIQIPPSRPSKILFLFSVGFESVLIQTPAMALSKISFCSRRPRPPLYTRTPPFWPPHILLPRITGLLPVLHNICLLNEQGKSRASTCL